MKRLTFVFMLVLLGATPVDAYVLKDEALEGSREVEFTRLPSTIILHDSEMKRMIEVESIKEIRAITEGIDGAASVDVRWTKGEKLGTLDFGDEEMIHIYYGTDRKTVYLQTDEETRSMSRSAFFHLFYPSIHSRPLPPGEGGDVQPDDFLPL
ncbi:hypothetical protein ACQ4XT_18905 [Halobacillus faecis]